MGVHGRLMRPLREVYGEFSLGFALAGAGIRLRFSNDAVVESYRLAIPVQHSVILIASPPFEVSLYFACMSRPVWRMVRIT